MSRRPRTFRIAFLAVPLAFATGNWRQLQALPAPDAVNARTDPRLPEPGDRVLVFSPHPDDEVLAVGGLLYRSRLRGVKVKVVYLTSGDGFKLCAAAKYRRWPDQRRMRALALVREAEARDALRQLRMDPESALFLGYPDRGLSQLWLDNWSPSNPYLSPHTAERSVTSSSNYRKGAPFCGLSVLQDVDRVLSTYRPDFVYYPDSTDDHPDHWAAHCLVRLALERRAALTQPPAVQRTYLIHRGEWPEPMRFDPDGCLFPPPELSAMGLNWERIPLTPQEVAAKGRALEKYRSQLVLSEGFLRAFVRRNELVAEWGDRHSRLPVRLITPSETMDSPEHSPSLFAGGDGTSDRFTDSTRDRFARARCGAVDFTSVAVDSSATRVRITASLRKPAAGWAAYDLYWKPVDGPAGSLETRRYRLSGFRCDLPRTRFTIRGRTLEVSVPRKELGGSSRIMVSAAAWSGPALLDRTPWRVVVVR